jgi:hypothetical protein
MDKVIILALNLSDIPYVICYVDILQLSTYKDISHTSLRHVYNIHPWQILLVATNRFHHRDSRKMSRMTSILLRYILNKKKPRHIHKAACFIRSSIIQKYGYFHVSVARLASISISRAPHVALLINCGTWVLHECTRTYLSFTETD